MSRESRLRLIGLHAVLIASTMQGLTPDMHSLASPRALEWLHVSVSAGRPDVDEDATSVEVALPVAPMVQTVLRRLAVSYSHPFASIDLFRPSGGPDPHSGECAPRPSGSGGDLISCLCRLTC